MILLLLVFSLLALVFPLSKIALVYSPAIFLTASRTLLAGLSFLGYYFIVDARKITVDTSFFTLLISNTIFNIYLVHVLQFWALCYVPTSIGCLINNTSPFFVAILSYLLLKEPISKARWLGLSIAFAALLPLIFTQTSINASQCSGSITLWALGALFSAACASAYGSIILCRISRSAEIPLSFIHGMSMVMGGIAMFATSFFLESWLELPSQFWLWFVKFVVPLSLLANVVTFSLLGFFLKRYSPTTIACASFVQIIATALYGWLFLHEQISWLLAVSMLGIAMGMTIFSKK